MDLCLRRNTRNALRIEIFWKAQQSMVGDWSEASDMNNRVTSQQSFCSVAPRVVVRLSLAHDQLAAKTNKGSCAPKLDKGGNQMAVL